MNERDRSAPSVGENIVDDDVVIVSPQMTKTGVGALLAECYGTPKDDLVGLIYMAMEYQRRRDLASLTSS